MNTRIFFSAVFLRLVELTGSASAASLGIPKGDPLVSASDASVDFLDFSPIGDLSSFGWVASEFTGVSFNGVAIIGFGVSYSLADPTSDISGGFDIEDDDGVFLSGELYALGYSEDMIELQFDSLSGGGSSLFGKSILMEILFKDPLGSAPFLGLVDGTAFARWFDLVVVCYRGGISYGPKQAYPRSVKSFAQLALTRSVCPSIPLTNSVVRRAVPASSTEYLDVTPADLNVSFPTCPYSARSSPT